MSINYYKQDPRLGKATSAGNSLLSSSLFGAGGGGSTAAQGAGGAQAPVYNDIWTPQLLAEIEQMGAGEQKRIGDQYDRNSGTLMAQLFARGLGTSSLTGSFQLGNEDRRSQAFLDLASQLAGQRLGAYQTGAGLALQKYGIDTQKYGTDTSASVAAMNDATQRYGIQSSANTQLNAAMLGRSGLHGVGLTSQNQRAYPQLGGVVGQSLGYPGSHIWG